MVSRTYEHLKTFDFLIKAPGINREKLVQFQFTKLAAIVNHAYRNIPFYMDLYQQHDFHPGQLKEPADITRIPMVTREDLAAGQASYITDTTIPKHRLLSRPTSGTTGVPVTLYRTWIEERLLNAFRWRAKFIFGQKLRDIHAIIIPWYENPILVHRIVNKFNFLKSIPVNAQDPPELILKTLKAIKPDTIDGYPGVLAAVADLITPACRKQLKTKFLITGGESLTNHLRAAISDGFGAPVLDMYGAHEFNLIAWECSTTGCLHICDDNMVLEVLDNGRPVVPGETGEAVGTTLHSYSMPLIRYRLGDRVVKGEDSCTCGQPFSTLKMVEGRITDYFILPDGKRLHPYTLFGPLLKRSFKRINQYHIVQEAVDKIVLLIVPMKETDPGNLEQLEADCQALVGDGVRIAIKLTDRIPLSKSGKSLNFRSLVASDV